MKKKECIATVLGAVIAVICLQVSVLGQVTGENRLANISSSGSSLKWQVAASHAGGTLTVVAPDGRVFRSEFRAGSTPDFALVDKDGGLPDGQYTYEIRLNPSVDAKKRRPKDDEPESVRATRKAEASNESLVESGGFAILNGSVILPGAIEGNRQYAKASAARQPSQRAVSRDTFAVRHHVASMLAMPDFVIADDLIVQGSACVGIDCVNGEVFGFDTIRLKENNTRLQFDDTSTTAGFPTNNWQIRANSSASGGGNFLAFVDQGATGNSETGTIVFEVDAGAPANSIRVASTGRVGFRTGTPVLDLHANTSNTPGLRLEQNSSGGFSAQTWDVAGNEANFFIRDVTSGSRLPFRIRPGAPTSSIDISSTGNVGIATASPGSALDVAGNVVIVGSDSGTNSRTNNTLKLSRFSMPPFTTGNLNFTLLAGATTATANIVAFGGQVTGQAAATEVSFTTAATTNTDTGTIRMTINSIGRVGIGTAAPDQLLSVNGDASKVGGGTWQMFSDERLKNIHGRFSRGLNAVMKLQPMRYEYKPDNALGLKSPGQHIGFSAQEVREIIPEAVSTSDSGYLMVNSDPILWTMLNAIKEQQKEIVELKAEVQKLRANVRRRPSRRR